MQKVTETQKLSENRPVMILMAGIYLPVIGLLIWKMAEDRPASEDFFGLVFTILIMALTFFFLFRIKTTVVLSPEEIRYQSSPFPGGLDALPVSEIASVSIEKHKWTHGYGYRYGFSGTRIMAMKPGKVLVVITRKGKQFRFGINREAVVSRFIEQEWPNLIPHGE